MLRENYGGLLRGGLSDEARLDSGSEPSYGSLSNLLGAGPLVVRARRRVRCFTLPRASNRKPELPELHVYGAPHSSHTPHHLCGISVCSLSMDLQMRPYDFEVSLFSGRVARLVPTSAITPLIRTFGLFEGTLNHNRANFAMSTVARITASCQLRKSGAELPDNGCSHCPGHSLGRHEVGHAKGFRVSIFVGNCDCIRS